MNGPLTNSMIDNAALWRLSLMLGADGIDVLARRVVGQPEILSARLKADPAARNHADAIEELIYSNPLLLQPFRKVDIVATGGFTLAVPTGACVDDIDAVFPPDDGAVSLTAPIDSRNELLFRLDRGMVNFLRRTFDAVEPTHALAVLGRYFSHRSRLGNSNKMYVDLGAADMNILVFSQLGLTMASTFTCPDIRDAAYYTLAAANTVALDMGADEIRIAGDADRRAELTPILRRFARNVMPAIFPASATVGDSSAMSAPFPLVILPLCE